MANKKSQSIWNGLDLFGDLAAASHGRKGRPPHVPTIENKQKIMLAMAHDWSAPKIARMLGITEPTLRRHYFSILKKRDAAAPMAEMKRLEYLYGQAAEGNVGAIKELNRLAERGELEAQARRMRDAEDEEPVGKKEKAAREARTAHEGTGWSELGLPN